jgi:cell division protein FtsL
MLDSDVHNSDTHLFVEFYEYENDPYKGRPFVRIMTPGDKTNVIETFANDDHKMRFPRQWLAFQMKGSDEVAMLIGVPLSRWRQERPDDLSEVQQAELQILKFQTVEQVATSTDAQLQRIGMGAAGLRERARAYLTGKNNSEAESKISAQQAEIDELKKQMQAFLSERRGPGRPKKEETVNAIDNAPVGDSGHK